MGRQSLPPGQPSCSAGRGRAAGRGRMKGFPVVARSLSVRTARRRCVRWWWWDADGGDRGCPGPRGCGRARPLPAPGGRAGLAGRAVRSGELRVRLGAVSWGRARGTGAGVWPAGRVAERGGGAEGQTGRGQGPGRPWRSSLAESCRGQDFPGASPQLSRGRPVGPGEGSRGLRGDPFWPEKLQLLVAKWNPWQGGSACPGGVEGSVGLFCCRKSC